MKTYNTVAIETDINGVDSNEELTALFARALELCKTAKASQANHKSSSSSTQYLSFDNVTYCIRNTESVDLKAIPLPEMDYDKCLESMQPLNANIKEEIPDEREDVVSNGYNEVADTNNESDTDELELEESTSHLNEDNTRANSEEVLECGICDKVYSSQEPFKKHMKTHEEENLALETQGDKDMGFVTEKHNEVRISKHYNQLYASQGSLEKYGENHNETCFVEESTGNEDQETSERTKICEPNIGENSILEKAKAGASANAEKAEASANAKQDIVPQEKDSSETLQIKDSTRKQHICPYCKKDYKYFSILDNHIRTHTKEKPFQCQHCDKAFSRGAILKEHEIRHFCNNKPYKCSFCDKSYANQKELKEHRGIHTGERPHKCEFCDKAFMTKRDLTQHLGTHTGERPHHCDFCEKKFKRKGDLVQHLKTHTGERPHQCRVCNKAFIRKGQLINHLRLHTGERPFRCNICIKAFIRQTQLDLHLMQNHA